MTKSGRRLNWALKGFCAVGILWVLFDIFFMGYRTAFERLLILTAALFSYALAWLVARIDAFTGGETQPEQAAPQDKPQE